MDALEEDGPAETPTTTVAIKTPDAIVVQDLINNEKIISETNQLKISMDCSERIVIAAYKVADYVPNLANAEQRQFWQVQVSFILLSSMKSAIQHFDQSIFLDHF